MLDVAVAYNRYKFLGEEFLTWIWYVIEKNQNLLKSFDPDFVALEIGNRIVLENPEFIRRVITTFIGERAHRLQHRFIGLTAKATNDQGMRHEGEVRAAKLRIKHAAGI